MPLIDSRQIKSPCIRTFRRGERSYQGSMKLLLESGAMKLLLESGVLLGGLRRVRGLGPRVQGS